MVQILIAGHGRMATGILSGLEMIFGKRDDIETVEFLDGETKTELDAKMDAALDRLYDADEILLLCDVLQGSPFQCAADRALRDERITVVFGVNLAMALEAVARTADPSAHAPEIAAAVVEAGRSHIGVFEPSSIAADEDDDW